MKNEWVIIKRRFVKKRRLKMRLANIWRGIKPFIEECIIYLFVILLFEAVLNFYQIVLRDSYDKNSEMLNWIEKFFILGSIYLFGVHIFLFLATKICTKKTFIREYAPVFKSEITLMHEKIERFSKSDKSVESKNKTERNEPKKKEDNVENQFK